MYCVLIRESLVVKRVLSVSAENGEAWLRTNIFHTKCTSGGKFCSMIIDEGSCENVISTTMVEKLGLKTEDHPQLYKLSWLKRGNDVKVMKRCLVHFSIGKKYTEEVWNDVVLKIHPIYCCVGCGSMIVAQNMMVTKMPTPSRRMV